MQHFRYLVPLLASLTLACGCSDTGAESDSQLPSSFGDCASPPCEVGLDAFTKNPGTIPHCRNTKDAVDLSCPAATGADTGTCGDNWAVRYVYGFPGDFYECIYDARTGVLVGARWSPDNHPTQFAGEQLPATCQLTAACDGGFAGAGGMGGGGGVGGASGTGGVAGSAARRGDL